MRKEYTAPKVRTETIAVGVFGDYDGSDCEENFHGFWNPFLGLCCGGG